MANIVTVGNTITLDALYTDCNGDPITPPDPRVDIIDRNGDLVVNQDTNVTFDVVGHGSYNYSVASNAPPGGWVIVFYGTVCDDEEFCGSDTFSVLGTGGGVGPVEGVTATVCQSWTDSGAILACGPDVEALEELDVEVLEDAGLVASEVLWNLSGRRYPGICTDVVRPCPKGYMGASEPYGWDVSWGWWRNGAWCGCSDGPVCGGCCGYPSQIKLGNRPIVANSVSVEIDGAMLTTDSWQIVDGVYLVRVDGERWPCCQDMSSPIGEPNTWEITYSYGLNPTRSGIRAASALARELALECAGSALCKLPKRLSTVTRQGSTMTFVDPMEFLSSGQTGITAVDLFLSSERYGRAHRPSAFVNPERATYVRRVTDAPGS